MSLLGYRPKYEKTFFECKELVHGQRMCNSCVARFSKIQYFYAITPTIQSVGNNSL